MDNIDFTQRFLDAFRTCLDCHCKVTIEPQAVVDTVVWTVSAERPGNDGEYLECEVSRTDKSSGGSYSAGMTSAMEIVRDTVLEWNHLGMRVARGKRKGRK